MYIYLLYFICSPLHNLRSSSIENLIKIVSIKLQFSRIYLRALVYFHLIWLGLNAPFDAIGASRRYQREALRVGLSSAIYQWKKLLWQWICVERKPYKAGSGQLGVWVEAYIHIYECICTTSYGTMCHLSKHAIHLRRTHLGGKTQSKANRRPPHMLANGSTTRGIE